MKFFRRKTEPFTCNEDIASLRLSLLVAMAVIDQRLPLSELDLLHQAVDELSNNDTNLREKLSSYLFKLLDFA